ncbi:MAG: nucleotide exchange factor GrpE, partial [Clostridia bacterium]
MNKENKTEQEEKASKVENKSTTENKSEEAKVSKEKELNEELSKTKEELEELKDRHTRLIAEFDNLKKRSAKEREGLYNSIISDIISSLLPVIDNLEKATEAEIQDEEYKKGIELVLKQFKDVLTANGVKQIEEVGQPFDPALHEAVSMIQD